MKTSNTRRFNRALSWAYCAAALLVVAISFSPVRAEFPPPQAAPRNPHADVGWRGALQHSFAYHRRTGKALAEPHAGGQYRYGFPVASYRWGWFGASRYYPTVLHHRGFNGDHKRWAYRHGY